MAMFFDELWPGTDFVKPSHWRVELCAEAHNYFASVPEKSAGLSSDSPQ